MIQSTLKISFPFLSTAACFTACSFRWNEHQRSCRDLLRACFTVSRDEPISAWYSKCVDVGENLLASGFYTNPVLELFLLP